MQGKFIPKNPQKYEGNFKEIYYRSSWEFRVLAWLDANKDVVSYSSEEVVIPYICATDGKWHSYYVDLKITFRNGTTHLIEIKPESQTVPPKTPKKVQSKRYINEVLTYIKNESKWKAADEYAKKMNYKFAIWTEKSLQNLGIRVI